MSICCVIGVFSTSLYAQSVAPKGTETNSGTIKEEITKPKAPKKAALDTEESFKFLGNQLLFQVKKRLKLATEAKEKKQSKSTVNKKFSFWGIEVERES